MVDVLASTWCVWNTHLDVLHVSTTHVQAMLGTCPAYAHGLADQFFGNKISHKIDLIAAITDQKGAARCAALDPHHCCLNHLLEADDKLFCNAWKSLPPPSAAQYEWTCCPQFFFGSHEEGTNATYSESASLLTASSPMQFSGPCGSFHCCQTLHQLRFEIVQCFQIAGWLLL